MLQHCIIFHTFENSILLSLNTMKFAHIILLLMFFSCSNRIEKTELYYPDGSKKTVAVYEGKDQKKVEETGYYQNGEIKIHGYFDQAGKRKGVWEYYYDNGKLWSRCSYTNGIKNGKSEVWYENGQKRYEGEYSNDRQVGAWKFWDEKGNQVHKKDYSKAE